MKKIMSFLVTVFLILSCSSDDNNNYQIVGKWKLIQSEVYGINSNNQEDFIITDYSNENIIYNFQSNGILNVSGGGNIGFPDEEYDYFFGEDHIGYDNPKVLLVKINNSKWTYTSTNGKMTLGQSYVDGPNLTFERI